MPLVHLLAWYMYMQGRQREFVAPADPPPSQWACVYTLEKVVVQTQS